MVRQVGPSNAKWHVRAAGDFTMTSQRKSELEAVNRRLSRNDPRFPPNAPSTPKTRVVCSIPDTSCFR